MQPWTPITYRDFWDVPRIFLVEWQGQLLLFDCPFDDDTEDFVPVYRIYLMPTLKPEELAGSWVGLPDRATGFLAELPVAQVEFDPTKRAAVRSSLLSGLLSKVKLGS